MQAMIGAKDLEEGRKTIEAARDNTLLPDMTNPDPDDAYSPVPYEHGARFMVFLEHRSGREAFDAFLRRWFDSHAFKSATTDQFLLFLKEQLLAAKPGVVTDAEIQEWLHSEGIPAFAVLAKSDAFERVERARDA